MTETTEPPIDRHLRIQKAAREAFDQASGFSSEHGLRIQPQNDLIRIGHASQTADHQCVVVTKRGAVWLLEELQRILGREPRTP